MSRPSTSPSAFTTHEVFNQPPALEDINFYTSDRVLMETAEREGAAYARDSLAALVEKIGTAEVIDLGRQANTYTPVLKSFDRFGYRLDKVEFHPAYHRLMALMLMGGAGLVTSLTFLWLSAPDLALTQLMVETVTTVLILLGLRWLPPRVEAHPARERPALRDRARRARLSKGARGASLLRPRLPRD